MYSNNNVEPTTPTQVMPFWVKLVLASDLARALKFALFGSVAASSFLLWRGQSVETIASFCLLIVAISFVCLVLPELWHILAKNVRGIAAVLEAFAEVAARRDFNQSGAIGDVIQLEPETKETIRLVPTNRQQRVLQSPSGLEVPIEDFVEFVRGLELNGLTRSKWVSENAKKPFAFKFVSGREMTRELYDAMCDILEKRAKVLDGRKQGTSGKLTAKPAEILNLLGLG